MTDREIVEIIGKNDPKGSSLALNHLYQNNYFVVEDLIKKNNGSKDDAKDIFQDSIVVLYSNIKKGELQLNAKISTYLYSVAKNLWLKKIRDSRLKTVGMQEREYDVSATENVYSKLVFTEKQQKIGILLQESGEKCKTLLRAFYYDKLSMKKISFMFGYSSEQVAKNQKVRCLKKLRAVIKSSNVFDELSHH